MLARSEWQDPAIREGLLCDQDGRVTEATMSNVYVLKDGVLLTPPLHQCGVRGAVRDWLFDCARWGWCWRRPSCARAMCWSPMRCCSPTV
ncbi:aminotransferase class IV [Paludibacterium denitrificans]|uniref:aminotransferase class IV n=1 Tax=Paludibacterium denitrificans TaxID=2675226 RepID=UPI001E59F035|nr:aminotransferase class IV [Paludibacterium denitrificans]